MNVLQFKEFLDNRGIKKLLEELKNGEVKAYDLIEQIISERKNNSGVDRSLTSLFYSQDTIRWGASYLDLSSLDLSRFSIKELLRMKFSNLTKWPSKDKLPKGFDPEQIMDKAKKFKGLGIDDLHKKGINGSGVTIAYIDTPFNIEHEEFNGLDTEYKTKFPEEIHFHGACASSRVVGQNLGVSPRSKYLFYEYEYSTDNVLKNSIESILKHLRDIIKKAKNGQRIDVIGISASPSYWIEKYIENENKAEGLKYQKAYVKLMDELEERNITFIDSEKFWDSGFTYAFMENPSKDLNDKDNWLTILKPNAVAVTETGRCVPCAYDINNYRYENDLGCASWSIPQVVGLFALAKQVYSDISYEEFVQLAHETADKPNKNFVRLINSVELIRNVSLLKKNEHKKDDSE